MIARLGDNELMTVAAERLRKILESSSNNDDFAYWDNLWTFQFKLKPVPEHAQLPYVQKLREKLKDRKDVVILTLNIDEEVGLVETFMKENKYNFPVLLGQAYAEAQGVNSIPRNWVVAVDGKVMFEGVGFGNDGEKWMKQAADVIEKVKGAN